MKIAITGAKGNVGSAVVAYCASKGYQTVQIDMTEFENNDTPNSETRVADTAGDYDSVVAAFQGCDAIIHLAAIPNPVNKKDAVVHANNVNSAFNGFRAAGELGIKRVCYASSVNAIGLAYSNQPLNFPYFPIDEDYTPSPTDSYALAKAESELQAKAFVNWYPGMKIACMRFHEVNTRENVNKHHANDWEGGGVKQLWGWVRPEATARACVAALEKWDNYEGMEVFNIHAPTTAQDTPSEELAKKYYPNVPIKGDLSGNKGFWSTQKAQRILGWEHYEME
jgi:nucleoside-diphosphate-sugar epimerase